MDGFLNILKPSGLTSGDVVSKLKRKVYPSKIGHLGTLDPLAVGVLPIAIGKATRLFDYMLKKVKGYYAVFNFGVETDTLDGGGKCIKCDDSEIEETNILNALKNFQGKIMQLPPMYSAKNIGGVRAYDLARQGIEVKLKEKQVEIFEFALDRKVAKNQYAFKILCSGGTYIRSLARDLAYNMGTVGYMSCLIRTKCGKFNLADSVILSDDISVYDNIISIENVLRDLETIEIPNEYFFKLSNGVKIKAPALPKSDDFLVKCGGKIFGLGKIVEGDKIKIKVNLRETE